MAVLEDLCTGSVWHHLTGDCIVGPCRGSRLPVLGSVQHLTAAQALADYPRAAFYQPAQPRWLRWYSLLIEKVVSGRRGFIPWPFYRTMPPADRRLPRLTMGLGIWHGERASFFPLTTIKKHDSVLIIYWQGQRLIVLKDPVSHRPLALFSPAETARWQGSRLLLDDGNWIENGQVYNANGERHTASRPCQTFTRWYGFAATFPNCEIGLAR